MDDLIEPPPSLEHRIKNLEAFISTLKEEMAAIKKVHDDVYLEVQKLRDEIFG